MTAPKAAPIYNSLSALTKSPGIASDAMPSKRTEKKAPATKVKQYWKYMWYFKPKKQKRKPRKSIPNACCWYYIWWWWEWVSECSGTMKMRGFPETRTWWLWKRTREIKMSEKHGILIKKTEATYLDVRNRINRGDASGRAKLGIDRSIHACVILFLVASVRKFSEEEKITENTKGCYYWELWDKES